MSELKGEQNTCKWRSGVHSNSSNSTASSVDATGAANVADMPAAAPATSSVLRSVLLRWKNCRRVRGLKPVVDRALKVCAGFLEAANAGQ